MSGQHTGTPVTEHSATVRGARLAWSEQGAGAAVLFAHGLTASGTSMEESGALDWGPVARAGRRLVRCDARGHGRSGGDPVPVQYTWPSLAEDLLALSSQLAGDAPVDGIGLSMGTATLLHAAVRAPGRFGRLVLTAPPTAWATRAAQAAQYEAAATLVEHVGAAALEELTAAAPVPPVLADLPDGASAPQVAPGLLPSVLRGAAASDLPDEERLRALALPVLLLAWTGDPGHPLATAERLAALIPGARLHVAATPADLRSWGTLAADFLTG